MISQRNWAKPLRKRIKNILSGKKIEILEEVDTAGANTPYGDVFKLAGIINNKKPGSIICVGGGSAIDCAKAANIISSVDPGKNDLEPFFGIGKVSQTLQERKIKLYPLIAVQVAAGSAAHLTKYANVTDSEEEQKKLIIDEAIIPKKAVFDYSVTLSEPLELTLDGALDGLAHSLEVYWGAGGKDFKKVEEICLTSIRIIVDNLTLLSKNLEDTRLREKIGLATDLGGYAIMMGSTNGPHLNSFSFVDILSHGKAVAITLPYYTVFFAPAIEAKLTKLVTIFDRYIRVNPLKSYSGKKGPRILGEIVAGGIMKFYKEINFPTTLGQVRGFGQQYIEKALNAARNPQLEMKLKSMPIPLGSTMVDEYLGLVLESARTGNFSLIKSFEK